MTYEEWLKILGSDEDVDEFFNSACSHEWKEYIGFTDKYWFCALCDKKSKEKPKYVYNLDEFNHW
jgi:hypothetical protein